MIIRVTVTSPIIERGNKMKIIKHTCGGPKWGRLTKGCPSCDELLTGKREPIKWHNNNQTERERIRAIQSHNCLKSGCGPICTAFDY